MTRLAVVVALAGGLAMSLHAQDVRRPAFELADVHPSPPSSLRSPARGGTPRDGLYRIWQATMVDLIRMAYGIAADKITGGPHWLELDKFDVVAKVPAGTTRASASLMLQALLAERFGLVLREEAKTFPVYALVTADGNPKLKEASGAAAGTCQQEFQPPTGPGVPNMLLTCKGTSMATLAQRLTVSTGGTQVVDATGRSGLWDFQVAIPLTSSTQGPNIKAITDNLARYLGLTLEPRSMSLPTIAVVQVNRTPTPNAPAVAEAFPRGPEPEFEVAEIKPSAGGQRREQLLPTGQLTQSAIPLRELIAFGWQVQPPARIVGPKTLDAPLWDVIARISSRSLDPMDVDLDAISAMMRRLLIDRFHLKVRFEDRPMEAPTLVAAGAHRLVKSDPNSRTRCTRAGVTGTSFPAMQLQCQNISLGEFTDRLPQLDPQDFQMPVADQTGIDGRWDITLVYTPAVMLRGFVDGLAAARAAAGAQGERGNAVIPTASDPTGAMTVAQAIERTLGLKLEMRRRPVPVLVVDSVDEKPTEN